MASSARECWRKMLTEAYFNSQPLDLRTADSQIYLSSSVLEAGFIDDATRFDLTSSCGKRLLQQRPFIGGYPWLEKQGMLQE